AGRARGQVRRVRQGPGAGARLRREREERTDRRAGESHLAAPDRLLADEVGRSMPKLKHVAITTHDVEKTARFYVEAFGMKQMGKIDDSRTTASFLTDRPINPPILPL